MVAAPYLPATSTPLRLGRLASALLMVLLAGCQDSSDIATLPTPQGGPYRLGPGDQLHIVTYNEVQLTGDFTISASGDVAMPLLGAVHASGTNPAELSETIEAELRRRQILQRPSVTIDVIAYRPIFVLGEVARPGQYPYQPGMTMLTAVAVAGGFTYRAVQGYASDVRVIASRPVIGRITPQSYVEPGDVVNILERRF